MIRLTFVVICLSALNLVVESQEMSLKDFRATTPHTNFLISTPPRYPHKLRKLPLPPQENTTVPLQTTTKCSNRNTKMKEFQNATSFFYKVELCPPLENRTSPRPTPLDRGFVATSPTIPKKIRGGPLSYFILRRNSANRNNSSTLRSKHFDNSTLKESDQENNLELRLDDWTKPKPKFLSHIYLGSSLFPIITEESRVIGNDNTMLTPRPNTTRNTTSSIK